MSKISTRFLHRTSVLALATLITLTGNAIVAPAQSNLQLDKHSRKIERKLDKYNQGAYLHLVMSDATDVYGRLGALSPASFTFNNAESNSVVTYKYADIDRVNTDREDIGHNSEPIHFRHLVPVAITAAVVAAGALTYMAVR